MTLRHDVRSSLTLLGGVLASIFCAVALFRYVSDIHDGTSVREVVRSFAAHQVYFRSVTIVLVFALASIIVLSGRIFSRLWAADQSPNHYLCWIALISEIAFLGTWSVALGLGMAACQLYPYTSPEIVHALLGGYAIVASILGITWTPFGIACFVISRRAALFPRWFDVLTLVATAFNFAAVFGLFAMTGPLNPYDGQVAVGLPFYGLVTWYIMGSATMALRRA